MAYGISKAGSDWVEIFVMDLKTKKLLPDHIKWAKFTSIAWYKDGSVSYTHLDVYKRQPVCSERKISYATFTICDILPDSTVKILEHDNPDTIIFRKNSELTIPHTCLLINELKNENSKREIKHATFYPQLQDRLILLTDGITQAGMGTDKYPCLLYTSRCV